MAEIDAVLLGPEGIMQLLGAVQCNSQGIVDLAHHRRLGDVPMKRGESLLAPCKYTNNPHYDLTSTDSPDRLLTDC